MDSSHVSSWSSGPAPGVSSLLIQVFSHNVKLLFIKPFSLYLITALESPNVRDKIGNWLDWKRGFLVVGLPSEASLMTWKSSNEAITTGSVQVASGFQ